MLTNEFQSKVAIVTGGARGIGKSITRALAEHGAQVIIADIDAEAAEKTCQELSTRGLVARAIPVDTADSGQVNRMVEEVVGHYHRVDILVNNAGISPKKDGKKIPIVEMPLEQWERVIAVNLHGCFYCAQACARHMIKQRYGKMVNMSSSAGKTYSSIPGSHYLTSKAGVIGLTRALAGELAPYGINVNAVAPGRIETEMIHDVPPEVNQEIIRQIPVGRCGTPQDVTEAVLFLLSDKANFITGVTLDVNGGKQMF
ncbi:hypothetical protein SY88_15595 [Clostridiales bacterium PH28_bin88]|nr:hypothetical protein SY88_15595 [Clostridiales bacterium PH28_bin88]